MPHPFPSVNLLRGTYGGQLLAVISRRVAKHLQIGHTGAMDIGAPIDDLRDFLDRSPSPFHVVATVTSRLAAAGFTELVSNDEIPVSGFATHDGAVIAWRLGDAPVSKGLKLVGAHTDSPNLRLRPNPEMVRFGWHQLAVEVYGGILNNSWLDRDLGIAGRIVTPDGASHLVHIAEPIARVPQLAVHLDRGVNENGLILNRQEHLIPVWATSEVEPFTRWIARRAGTDVPVTWELGLYDLSPAAIIGVDASLLASGRLDNQVSCWAAVTALIESSPTDHHGSFVVLSDHEEVGSTSTTGAGGRWFEYLIERVLLGRGADRAEILTGLSASICVSADNAHALHPNYLERHDMRHAPRVNEGPAVKINVNQRYATTAPTAAAFIAACEAEGVPHQQFVSRNDQPCGSTIGPALAAGLGVDVVDVGVPQLSMHSARELCGVADPVFLSRALRRLLS